MVVPQHHSLAYMIRKRLPQHHCDPELQYSAQADVVSLSVNSDRRLTPGTLATPEAQTLRSILNVINSSGPRYQFFSRRSPSQLCRKSLQSRKGPVSIVGIRPLFNAIRRAIMVKTKKKKKKILFKCLTEKKKSPCLRCHWTLAPVSHPP
ncbi:Piso0_005194 [Millerozyma farinosa CBS 7064]|uniref:Piso0_005194 protein n=1 Tax=Pichia sorbitophila (strain ATCC MYA-4447 / BCRC 22081 / CBS 7064 / NBRC 10061 / NRRL Y-12695) TaxID=559304 RepID=G8Y1I7_PICSO|nr:Piso0_005194 [Millerozyma farinosa CBS 7064]